MFVGKILRHIKDKGDDENIKTNCTNRGNHGDEEEIFWEVLARWREKKK